MACSAYQWLQDLHWCLVEKPTTDTTTCSFHVLDVNPDVNLSPELQNQVVTDLMAEFNDVFVAMVLQPMNSTPMTINLCKGAVPYQFWRAWPIPLAWRNQVKSELDSMYKKRHYCTFALMGSEQSEWCHPLVVTPKSDGKIWMCVNFPLLKRVSSPQSSLHHGADTNTYVHLPVRLNASGDKYFCRGDISLDSLRLHTTP